MDRSMLNKATSADDTPTPGYLYGEIARSTFGDVNAPQQLADYLLKKLERDNPHVKVKCLRIIRHVCDQGKGDFRRAIQKKAELVKGCLQYRGSPDTLKGDAYNKAVREEADAAIKSVFASDSSTNAYGMNTESVKKMEGFGSDAPGGGGSYGGSSGGGGGFGGSSNSFGAGSGGGAQQSYGSSSAGGMVGFGNPNFNNAAPQEENTYITSAKTMAGGMFSKLQTKVASVSGQASGGGGGNGGMDMPTSTYRAPNMNMPAQLGSAPVQGQWGQGQQSQRSPPPPSTSTSTGEYEGKVVNELCAPGGPRVAPSAQALEEFSRKCESLDATAVASELRKKLEDPSWQTRLKALHAIEALCDKGQDGITGHVAQFSSELLFECQEMPQCKAKAAKVLYLLGMGDTPAEAAPRQRVDAPAAAAPAAAAPVSCMDLLDMGDAPSQGVSNLMEAEAYSAPQAAPAGLFDFATSTPAVSQVPAAAPAGGLFGNLSVGGAAAPAPATGSMFGGLSVGGAQDLGPAYSPPAAAAPSLLAGLQAASPMPQSEPASAGMGLGGLFGGLSMGDAGGASATSQAPAAAPLVSDLTMPQVAAAPAPATAPGPMDATRTAHLNILAGGLGGGPMGAAPAMTGGPMMGMQPGPMGMMGQQPNMGQMGQQGQMGMMGQQQMGQGMMGQPHQMAGMGMMGQPNPMMGAQGGMGMAGGMGMGMPQMQNQQMAMPQMQNQQMAMGMQGMGMPQMQNQQMGMQGMQGMGMQGMGQVPMGGYGGAPSGMMGMPNQMHGGGMMGGMGGPGSAFGFIGGAGGPGGQMMGGPDLSTQKSPAAAAQDNAFSFVTDEIGRS